MFRALGLAESARCGLSLVGARVRAHAERLLGQSGEAGPGNYASYLLRTAGERGYRLFYEPYARKVWGRPPAEISLTAVQKRISMTGPAAFLKDIVASYVGAKRHRHYYYLTGGIATLPELLAQRLVARGTRVLTDVQVLRVERTGATGRVVYRHGGRERSARFDRLVSTIPIDELVRALGLRGRAAAPAARLEWTGLRLVYVSIEGEPRVGGESFYFPELCYAFGRVSVPHRFQVRPRLTDGRSCLVCEVPCGDGGRMATVPAPELLELCFAGLRQARLIDGAQRIFADRCMVVDLPKVYPVFKVHWETALAATLREISARFPAVYSSGRCGFFLHNNIDHAIDIGLELAAHLRAGKAAEAWHGRAAEFQSLHLRD
jgi:protoporphyrinogen oxidase